MKRIVPLTLVVSLLFATSAFAAISGAWTASTDDKKPGRVHLNITRGRNQNFGNTMELSRLSGLAAAQANATAMTPVQFFIQNEAGKITFEGTFRDGQGAGHYTFEPDHSYPSALRAVGVEFRLDRRREDKPEDTLFTLALHDVSVAFIRSMQAEGYRETLEKYLSFGIFGVNPEFVRELRSLGFKNLDSDKLVAFRIHGVTPKFISEMHSLGFRSLDSDELVTFRIHGVTAKFITELRELGYDKLDADDLVAMRIHGVTPAYIRELEQAGYRGVPADKLVAMRIHGVDAKFIKGMRK